MTSFQRQRKLGSCPSHDDWRSIRAISDRVAMLHDGLIRWTGPVGDMDAADDPYLQQFIHGRAEGPIESVR